ncbi:MAG: hypothetical protein AAFY34_08065 [Pseudomonadota bacterium]
MDQKDRLRALILVSLAGIGILTPAVSEEVSTDVLIQENFEMADENGDGALTTAEFRTFIDLQAEDEIGRSKTVKGRGLYDRAFSRADADSNGNVTLDEITNG